MQLSLEGKTAVVCGSTQGIGWAIAEELAQLGARCILLARNRETLAQNINQLEAQYPNGHQYEVADFANVEAVKKAIERLTSSQTVHILINNTGGPAAGPIAEATSMHL